MKISTIARVAALAIALINQCLAIFGKGLLPFTEFEAYQIVTVILTCAATLWNAWKNNDFTAFAKLSGKILEKLKDGEISEEDVTELLKEAQPTKTKADENDSEEQK